MNNYIIQHALASVWCSPEHDYQHIFQPARLTVPKGVLRFVNVEWSQIALPDLVNRYHVYQIGQLSPVFLHLIPDTQVWYPAGRALKIQEMTIDIYNQTGLHFPLFECYFRKTSTQNLILAIREQPTIGKLSTDSVFVRFYSNAYFRSERSQPLLDELWTNGKRPQNRNETLAFQKEISDLQATSLGHVYVFHNGWLVNHIVTDSVKPNDVLEYVLDTSISKVWDITIDSLETFESTLDHCRKYLIKQPNAATDSIDYHDDLDFYLYETGANPVKGLFFHKGYKGIFRMVTHSAYSVAVQSILDHANKVSSWLPLNLSLRVFIRKSGYDRPLVFETNRIKELYKLDDNSTLRAMVGAQANVLEWQAAHLEASAYTAIMEHDNLAAVTSQEVQAAYGYNATSLLVGDALHRVIVSDGRRVIFPPFKLRYHATFYEYDALGKLIDFHYHNEGRIYGVHSPFAFYVEGISGQGGLSSGTAYDSTCSPNPPGFFQRAYISPKVGGVSTNEWRLAVPVEEFVQNEQGTVWVIDPEDFATAVRNDRVFLSVHLDLTPLKGYLEFTIAGLDITGSVEEIRDLEFPTGKLDIFLNGHPLIENLDYYVQWPQVVICNKEYLLPEAETQRVTVRCPNFPDSNIQRLPPAEYGFVTHGYLSRNARFDVRDDRVLRYVIEGRLWDRKDLVFSEDNAQVTVAGVRNGAPYCIDEILVPLDELVDNDTHVFRAAARETDLHVSDYLTLYYPEVEIPGPSIIPTRYTVLSPFVSRIHDLLQSGFLYPPEIKGQYSDEDIRNWVEEWEFLLDFDPLLNPIKPVDDRYVHVQPHQFFTETELDIYQYTFLERVIALYFQGRIDLSSHVHIKAGWL